MDQKYVGTSDGLVDGSEHLSIGEMADLSVSNLNADETAYVLGQTHIGVPAENLHVFSV